MRYRITTSTIETTIEELGKRQQIAVDAEIEFEATPGDPGCMYQRNGDPGWPPEDPAASLIRVTVTKYYGGDGDRERDCSGWFDLLDRLAFSAIEREWESRWEQDALESLAEREYR